MRVEITTGRPAEDWVAWHPNDAEYGLPEGEAIERIFVPNILRFAESLESLASTLEFWWASPDVSVRTLLGLTVPRDEAKDLYPVFRAAGWGIACPYKTGLLSLDKWPIHPDSVADEYFTGGIARAIKKKSSTPTVKE